MTAALNIATMELSVPVF